MSWTVGAGLHGQGVLVTGAAGGIGRAVAEAFAACGARVAALDLRADAAAQVVASLPGAGHAPLGFDLRDISEYPKMIASVRASLGNVAVLAHCAAVLLRQDVADVTIDDWDLQHDVNLRATFFLNRAIASELRAQGVSGRIINLASQAWWTGGVEAAVVYAATKGGIVSLTRGLARTYGPAGITVNCVAPGGVDTPMLRSGMSDAAMAAFVDQIPLGRLAKPEDVAGAVVFLASQHAGYITGATLNVSGGQLMY